MPAPEGVGVHGGVRQGVRVARAGGEENNNNNNLGLVNRVHNHLADHSDTLVTLLWAMNVCVFECVSEGEGGGN